MKIGTCRGCSYWCETPGFETGECHKNAPVSKADPTSQAGRPPMYFVALFPPTKAGNWCGDFHFKQDQGRD